MTPRKLNSSNASTGLVQQTLSSSSGYSCAAFKEAGWHLLRTKLLFQVFCSAHISNTAYYLSKISRTESNMTSRKCDAATSRSAAREHSTIQHERSSTDLNGETSAPKESCFFFARDKATSSHLLDSVALHDSVGKKSGALFSTASSTKLSSKVVDRSHAGSETDDQHDTSKQACQESQRGTLRLRHHPISILSYARKPLQSSLLVYDGNSPFQDDVSKLYQKAQSSHTTTHRRRNSIANYQLFSKGLTERDENSPSRTPRQHKDSRQNRPPMVHHPLRDPPYKDGTSKLLQKAQPSQTTHRRRNSIANYRLFSEGLPEKDENSPSRAPRQHKESGHNTPPMVHHPVCYPPCKDDTSKLSQNDRFPFTIQRRRKSIESYQPVGGALTSMTRRSSEVQQTNTTRAQTSSNFRSGSLFDWSVSSRLGEQPQDANNTRSPPRHKTRRAKSVAAMFHQNVLADTKQTGVHNQQSSSPTARARPSNSVVQKMMQQTDAHASRRSRARSFEEPQQQPIRQSLLLSSTYTTHAQSFHTGVTLPKHLGHDDVIRKQSPNQSRRRTNSIAAGCLFDTNSDNTLEEINGVVPSAQDTAGVIFPPPHRTRRRRSLQAHHLEEDDSILWHDPPPYGSKPLLSVKLLDAL